MITQLKNPKTNEYLDIKELVLGRSFPWFYCDASVDVSDDFKDVTPNWRQFINAPFYSHNVLDRPEMYGRNYSAVNSNEAETVIKMLNQLFDYNGIELWHWIRINFNCVQPHPKRRQTVPHHDHTRPHNNLLIYLTGAGGETIVGQEVHDPKEDDVIIWPDEPDGDMHCHCEPETERRIVLVATYV